MVIDIDAYLMGRDEKNPCPVEVIRNAGNLLSRVNYLLGELGISPNLSSGWRPEEINRLAGGSKNSAHISGEAIDLEDKNYILAVIICENPSLLEEHNLYMENPKKTKGWVHLQTRPTKSGKRIFEP